MSSNRVRAALSTLLAAGAIAGWAIASSDAAQPAATRPATKPATGPATAPAAARDTRAAIARAKVDITTIQTAADMFELDVGRFPTTGEGLKALVEAPKGAKDWHGPYLKQLRDDPWGHPYRYQVPGTHNPSGFDLSSAGPDGQAGTRDDIGNW